MYISSVIIEEKLLWKKLKNVACVAKIMRVMATMPSPCARVGAVTIAICQSLSQSESADCKVHIKLVTAYTLSICTERTPLMMVVRDVLPI